MNKLILLIIMLTLLIPACDAFGHVEANVPEESQFTSLLTKDLNAYFETASTKPVSVKFELLRKVATQSGVAYPKFYAWVKVYAEGKLLKQGAVRLAAIDQTSFDVTNFLTAQAIQADPTKIESIFPAALCPRILELAKEGTPAK
jgi:hypothetical protein